MVYSVYEIEFLAGAFAFSVFRVYIAGSKVDWYVDHAALKACDRRSTGRTQRWLAELLTIDFRVIFVQVRKTPYLTGCRDFQFQGLVYMAISPSHYCQSLHTMMQETTDLTI